MYGMVNIAVEELVTSKFGPEKWAAIKSKAGITVESFGRMSSYPDDVTFKLVAAASEVLGVSADDVLQTFGEFWVLYTGQKGYGYLFDLAGGSLKDFLFNLDNLHTRVGQNFPKLVPPSFRFDTLSEDHYRMHYHSDRQGLCPMVWGLIKGLSARFETPVDMSHPVCQRQGADHCEFLMTIGKRNG